MAFDQPWALALLALVPLLWLVRHRTPRRRILVAAPFFWTSRPQPDTARWAAAVARHPLVWVQTALAVALIAALAGPRVGSTTDAVALVLDLSMSMGARDDNGTRLTEALDRARAIVESQPRGTRVVVWAAGAVPRRVGDGPAGSGLPPSALAMSVTDGWVDLEAAAASAARDASAPRRVFVISDRRAPVRSARVEWVPVGRPVGNVALSGLVAWRPPEGRRDDLRVTVVVRNYGAIDVRPTLTVSHARGSLLQQPFSVAAGRSVSLSSTVTGASVEGLLTARLAVEDGLTADNVRYATVKPSMPRRALVIGRNRFVDAALEALGDIEVVGSADQPHDVVICVACATAPPGHTSTLVIPPAGPSPAPTAPVTVVRPDHPSVEHITLDGIEVAPQAASTIAENAVVIARAGGTPVLVAAESGGRRLLQLNLDATDPGVALNPAFPLLVSRMVDWLSSAHVPMAETRAGDPFVWRPRPGAVATGRAVGTTPNGRPMDVASSTDTFVVADTSTAGPYSLTAGDRTVEFVVNPASLEESDLSSPPGQPEPLAPGQLAAATPPVDTSGVSLASACLVVALVLLLIESRLRHRMGRAASEPWPWPGTAVRIAVRVAAAALILAAIAGLRLWTGTAPIAMAFVIDRSDSTSSAWRAFEDTARRLAQSLDPMDQTGVVVFGASAAVERRVQAGSPSSSPFESQIEGSGTDLESALRTARELLPRDGSDRRLVLFTDGRQTTGDAGREAALAAADLVRIDVVPPPSNTVTTARASRVVAPAVVRVDERFDVGVVVEGPAGVNGRLQLLGAGPPQERAVALPAEGSIVVTFSVGSAQPGVRAFHATFTPDPTPFDVGAPQPGAVQAGAVVSVVGPMRVLWAAEGPPQPLRSFAGVSTDLVRANQLPAGTALSTYDAVILDDVDPGALRPEQRTSLAQYVDGGGGLLVLGTERSLPPNPTGDTAFDDLLPVDTQPRSGARGSTMALVVAFDKSGSMEERVSGTAKIEYARQAVRSVVQVLPPGDAVGVIAFDGAITTVAPMSTTRDPAGLDTALRRLRPEGSTAIAPALSQARTWMDAPALKGVSRKHVLLISDGRTS
ncbi:MAG TPA: VWA domain-containing protein, partial [Vicinamibacterales bacterium]